MASTVDMRSPAHDDAMISTASNGTVQPHETLGEIAQSETAGKIVTGQAIGAKVAGSDDVLIIACGAIAREIVTITRANQLDHITLRCLPADLHNAPQKITGELRKAIRKAREDGFDTIFVGYGDCGTGGHLDMLCEAEGVERLPGAHCYAFFTGVDEFMQNSDEEITSFYLTDFLARQFDAFITRPLGLDRYPELRDMYFGNYEKVVYLAQTDDPVLDARAQAAAETLGLRYERRKTGYGDLAQFLNQWGNNGAG